MDTPEHTQAPLPTDSDWEEEIRLRAHPRITLTPVECAVVHPAFLAPVNQGLPAGWIMPEELKRDAHLNLAMPEFFVAGGLTNILAVGSRVGSRVNPIKLQ
jgi:hypothetical protein